MNNYENLTKDFDTFKEFINKHEIQLDCVVCSNSGFACGGNNCTNNFIKFLELEVEEKQPTDVSAEDFCKYVESLDEATVNIGGTKMYTSINYLCNHLDGWIRDGYKLSNNQKKIILDMEKRYREGLEQIHKLQKVFDKCK